MVNLSWRKSSKSIGKTGEQLVFSELRRADKAACLLSDGGGFDIVAHGRAIEVKTASYAITNKFQFCLYRKVNGIVKTDVNHADVLICVVLSDSGLTLMWVIPTSVVANQKTLHLKPFRGKYEQYRVNSMGELNERVMRSL